MKDTLHRVLYDTTTAVTAGTGASVISHSQIVMLVATLFAPVIRDLLIKFIDYHFSKK